MRRRVTLTICALAAAALLAPASADALEQTYSFTGSAEGWTVSQSETAPVQPAVHYPELGVIAAQDTGPETGCPLETDPCELLFMLSPGYSGTLGANYGGSFSFDIATDGNPLYAGIMYIDSADDAAPELQRVFTFTSAASRVTIPLTEAGWQLCGGTPYACFDASEAQFRQVLSYAVYTDLMVDAVAGIGEGYALDNVTLAEAAPAPPASPAPVPVPTAKKKKKCKRKKGGKSAAAAAKRCKKKKKKARRSVAAALAAAPRPSPRG